MNLYEKRENGLSYQTEFFTKAKIKFNSVCEIRINKLNFKITYYIKCIVILFNKKIN